MGAVRGRQVAIAAGYGLAAGTVAALVLKLMNLVSALVWAGEESRLRIFLVILGGGVIIAALRGWTHGQEQELSQQVDAAGDPTHIHRKLALLLAASAIVAVAFGGSVGPEAGILAVVAQMSALVALALGRTRDEQELIGRVGATGALSGVYSSPPGGAAIVENASKDIPPGLLFLAAVAGLLGFLLTGSLLLEGGGMRIRLPDYVAPGDGTDMLTAIVPAVLGGLIGLAFVVMLPLAKAALARLGGVTVQTLVGTLIFAGLAASFPILRFSGHHEMEMMLAWGREAAMAALLALGLLKALALAICLAAGWRGGAVFPLLFAGAAAGGAALAVMPSASPTLLLIAGMTAASTVGMGKPVGAVMITIFLVSPFAPGPLMVGAVIGYGFSLLVPKPELH